MKYRKKPVVIDAVQFTGFDGDGSLLSHELKTLVDNNKDVIDCDYVNDYISIKTLEGVMFAFPGSWIICGIKGELYPCKNDIFLSTYEPA